MSNQQPYNKGHKLSNIDTENRNAVCSICGFVSVAKGSFIKEKQYWRCTNAFQRTTSKLSFEKSHFLSNIDEQALLATCAKCGEVTKISKRISSKTGKISYACHQSLLESRIKIAERKKATTLPTRHKLISEINPVDNTGVCEICGPVIFQKGGKNPDGSIRWRCSKIRKDTYRKENPEERHVISHIDEEGRVGHCALCGPVKVTHRDTHSGKQYWRCLNDQLLINRTRKYDITKDQFNQMVVDQNSCCNICKKKQKLSELCVDHDHTLEGENKETIGSSVRSLVCRTCNLMLGMAQDSSSLLREAADYLDLHKTELPPCPTTQK